MVKRVMKKYWCKVCDVEMVVSVVGNGPPALSCPSCGGRMERVEAEVKEK